MTRATDATGSWMPFVLVVLCVGLLSGCGPGPSVSSLPSASPTGASPIAPVADRTPSTLPAEDHPVTPGRYTIASDGYRYTFTVPADGWLSLDFDFGVIQGDNDNKPPDLAALAVWGDPSFVYLEPCQWTGTERSAGTTPEEWVAAIGEIDELSPTAPMDVEVGGYAAKRIQITVSEDVDTDDCVEGEYRVYEGRTHIGARQTDDIWIVGIPGGDRRVIVTSYFASTPEHARAQLEAMMESMSIEH